MQSLGGGARPRGPLAYAPAPRWAAREITDTRSEKNGDQTSSTNVAVLSVKFVLMPCRI